MVYAVALLFCGSAGSAHAAGVPAAPTPVSPPTKADPFKPRLAAALALLDDLKFHAAYRELSQLEKDFPTRAAEVRPLRHDVGQLIYALDPPPDPRARKPVLFSALSAFDRLTYPFMEKEWTTLCAAPRADLLKATDLFARVKEFNVRNPDFPGGWLLQVRMALGLDRLVEGGYAGQQLYTLGLARSINPEVIALFVALEKRRWMTKPPPRTDPAPPPPTSKPPRP